MKSRISNLPFLHTADGIYESTTKSHFRPIDISAIPVNRPKLSHLVMQKTNLKMYDGKCAEFKTTYSAFRPLPMTTAELARPITSVKTSMPEGKFPDSTYKSYYTKHQISPIPGVQKPTSMGVSSSLRQEKKDEFCSMYREYFQYNGCPPPLPLLESIEKQRIQYSSIPRGDPEKILDRATVYSTSFGQSDALSHAKVKESLLPNMKKYQPLNLQELGENEWITTSAEEFRAHKYGPVTQVRVNQNLSYVFKGKEVQGKQEKLSTTNQSFFQEISRTQFPVHVDGSAIRNKSRVQFGRPDLAGKFYNTTSQEQFRPKEVIRPKPPSYPPSHVLYEQEPEQMMTTTQKDFAGRQQLSPSHLQRVKESHIKPLHAKQDFRTTCKETFVLKPYCKPSLINPRQHQPYLILS